MTEPLPLIWTAGGIGRFLGLGPHGVYALARESDAPIRKVGGRLCAFQDELETWMRRPQNRVALQKQKPT